MTKGQENDGDTNYNWCSWYSHERNEKATRELEIRGLVEIIQTIALSRSERMLYSHLHVHAASQRHNDKDARGKTQEETTQDKDARRLLYKYFTSHFIARVRKVNMWEDAGDRTLTSYFDPTVMTVTLCLSCSSNAGVHSIGAFRGPPRSGVGFPTTSRL